jgi:beta-galactosidase
MKHHLVIVLILTVAAARAEPDTILYGAAYYHEYMPYDRLDRDVELMQKAGITVVRLGESTWTSWEPHDGDFQFSFMDRIVNAMHKAGIRVIMGTPTYSIPPWMHKKHPDIVVTRFGSTPRLSSPWHPSYPGFITPGGYGPRQNMDLTHPEYRRYCERIIRRIAERYAKHPAIIGWQVDNETAPNGLPLANVQRAFVDRLTRKFATVQKLNRAWGLAYWGQLIDSWDEFPSREGAINPGYKLEWERFQHSIVTDFLAWQTRIIGEYRRPDQFITHDFVGGVRTNIDAWAISAKLDIAAANIYHATQDKLDGQAISLGGDFARSLKHKTYFVLETNAQAIGWDSRAQFPPYDGQLRLSAWAHIASGASLISYWHWASLHYGQETYWRGVLGHDLEPNRAYREVARIGAELKRLGPQLAGMTKQNDVAVLFSSESHHAIQYMPFSDDANYMSVLNQMYSALYRLNVEADFVTPESDFSRYKVLLVPPLYVASDAVLGKVARFVENGGHVVMSFKSGFANEHSTVRWQRAPGPLRKAAGFCYQEFSNLVGPVRLQPDRYRLGENNRATIWAEFLMPETADVLERYEHPFFGQWPALTRNKHGKGTLTYQGAVLSNELQQAVIREALELAGLNGSDRESPEPVRIRHARMRNGARVHFYLNFSGMQQSLGYAYAAGRELVSGKPVVKGQRVILPAWDLAVVVESEAVH